MQYYIKDKKKKQDESNSRGEEVDEVMMRLALILI
jgi:hypothetical protein